MTISILCICFLACNKTEDMSMLDVCEYKNDIFIPNGYVLEPIGQIDFNGGVKSFQFISEEIGYAMLSNNVGGYVEMFKTIDGGELWTDIEVNSDHYSRNMTFKNSEIGLITVHDVTGCPPPNCQDKCVILKTQDGGKTWRELEIENLQGILYHPQYDEQGDLFAIVQYGSTSSLVKSIDDGNSWELFFESSQIEFSTINFSFRLFENQFYISAKGQEILVVDKEGKLLNTLRYNSEYSISQFEILDKDNIILNSRSEILKTSNRGNSWTIISDSPSMIVGFESANEGLILTEKSTCPTDVVHSNQLFSSTQDGGIKWSDSAETTTNLSLELSHTQKISESEWLVMISNRLYRLRKT